MILLYALIGLGLLYWAFVALVTHDWPKPDKPADIVDIDTPTGKGYPNYDAKFWSDLAKQKKGRHQ